MARYVSQWSEHCTGKITACTKRTRFTSSLGIGRFIGLGQAWTLYSPTAEPLFHPYFALFGSLLLLPF
ncbi:hypothetical protein ACT691_05125 [Vibrio metschnikovii]